MKKIQVKVLNPGAIKDAEEMCVAMARLTQRGEKIKTLEDFEALLHKPYSERLLESLLALPHPTIQKFGVINVVVVGASRRFLAQVTRHQNEVKFMSASIQYSDYSTDADFVMPLGLSDKQKEKALASNQASVNSYKELIDSEINHDDAGYLLPQSLRNVLVISATPYQWKHMILQRTCRRNTEETRLVFLMIQAALEEISPVFMRVRLKCCPEGPMTCKRPVDIKLTPRKLLENDYKEIFQED